MSMCLYLKCDKVADIVNVVRSQKYEIKREIKSLLNEGYDLTSQDIFEFIEFDIFVEELKDSLYFDYNVLGFGYYEEWHMVRMVLSFYLEEVMRCV